MRHRAWILAPVVFPLVGAAIVGARNQPLPREGWEPLRIAFSGPMTAANKQAATAKLQALLRVFQQVPELAEPRTFVVSPLFQGGPRRLGFGDVEDPRNVIEYGLTLDLCDARYGESFRCGSIVVAVNFLNPPGNLPIHDAQGRGIYIESPRGDSYRAPDTGRTFSREPLPLATETYFKLSPTQRSWVTVIFTADRDLPWKPVTREEYYNAVVFDVEGKNGSKLEARGISVHISASAGGGPPPPAVHNALWQTWKKLDWAAINRLVDHTR